jgi:hypothetical protein
MYVHELSHFGNWRTSQHNKKCFKQVRVKEFVFSISLRKVIKIWEIPVLVENVIGLHFVVVACFIDVRSVAMETTIPAHSVHEVQISYAVVVPLHKLELSFVRLQKFTIRPDRMKFF